METILHLNHLYKHYYVVYLAIRQTFIIKMFTGIIWSPLHMELNLQLSDNWEGGGGMAFLAYLAQFQLMYVNERPPF